jgi:hypothetical protein
MSKKNKQEDRNNTYRVRFTDSELHQVIKLKAEIGEVADSLATFIAKTMTELASTQEARQ